MSIRLCSIPLGLLSHVQILYQVTAVSGKERKDYCTQGLRDGELMTQGNGRDGATEY